MLMKCADIEVVGTALNGHDAIDQVQRKKPDVMTLDIEMPGMNGLEVLDHMMAQHPLPIIMVSALTKEGAEETFQALDRGAVDFIAKPMHQVVSEIGFIEGVLQAKVREAFQARHRLPTIRHADMLGEKLAPTPFSGFLDQAKPMFSERRTKARLSGDVGEAARLREFPLVVIGASTGGPNLLKTLIQDLPASFPAALLIIQHMPKYFTQVFAENLNGVAAVPILEAQDGDELRPGIGFVVPGDQHVVITREGVDQPRIRFAPNELEYPYRPSIDCAMASAGEQFGQSTVGLVLTGMGNDGMMGSQKIREFGGTVLVQDEGTSLVYGMPRAVVEAGHADAVIPDVQLVEAMMQAVDSVCLTKRSL